MFFIAIYEKYCTQPVAKFYYLCKKLHTQNTTINNTRNHNNKFNMINNYKKLLPFISLAIAIIFQNCTKTGNKAEPIQTKKDNYTLDIKIKGAINKSYYLLLIRTSHFADNQ